MSFDTSLRNTLRLNNVVTVREEDRKKKYANWLNLFKVQMSFFSYFKIKNNLDNEGKKEFVFFWVVYLESDIMGFFSSCCTPELRTSGGKLTLFIFIDPLSVCVKKKKNTTTHPTHTYTSNTQP